MHRFRLTQPDQMQPYLSSVWALMTTSYAGVAGGWHYDTPEQLLADSARWHLAEHEGCILAATLYKAKKGLKLMAMGAATRPRRTALVALQQLILEDLPHCWMELSENAERFVLKHCGGHRYILHRSRVIQLLGTDLAGAKDTYHYQRQICGIQKQKIALGSPCFHAAQLKAERFKAPHNRAA